MGSPCSAAGRAKTESTEPAEAFLLASVPSAVIDTGSLGVMAANADFAALLGLDVAGVAGLDILSLLDSDMRELVRTVIGGMAAGSVEMCQGRATWRRPDGETLRVAGWVRVIHRAPPGGSGNALMAVVPVGAEAGQGFRMVGPDTARPALGVVDHDWRLSKISPDATVWLGWTPEQYRGRHLQSLVHPDDVPLLLLALGRSGADGRGVATDLRVRAHDGAWTPVQCEVTPLCNHNPPRFAVAMWSVDEGRDDASAERRAARLEDHLWRIALEVAAAGIGNPAARTEAWWGDPSLRDMSPRQLEVLRRLVQGESVPSIARALYLSQSTVRNHLSSVYRRFGVHSQAELLARLLPKQDPTARSVD